MRAEVMALLPVVSVEGTPDIATAALQRWLAEAVWYPMALLPSQGTEWAALDATSARATVRVAGVAASIDYHFGGDGYVERASPGEPGMCAVLAAPGGDAEIGKRMAEEGREPRIAIDDDSSGLGESTISRQPMVTHRASRGRGSTASTSLPAAKRSAWPGTGLPRSTFSTSPSASRPSSSRQILAPSRWARRSSWLASTTVTPRSR